LGGFGGCQRIVIDAQVIERSIIEGGSCAAVVLSADVHWILPAGKSADGRCCAGIGQSAVQINPPLPGRTIPGKRQQMPLAISKVNRRRKLQEHLRGSRILNIQLQRVAVGIMDIQHGSVRGIGVADETVGSRNGGVYPERNGSLRQTAFFAAVGISGGADAHIAGTVKDEGLSVNAGDINCSAHRAVICPRRVIQISVECIMFDKFFEEDFGCLRIRTAAAVDGPTPIIPCIFGPNINPKL